MNRKTLDRALKALNTFRIETPSWGFADTGTRFGKFFQDAAAIDLNDKLADAGQVHRADGLLPDRRRARAVGFQEGRGPEGGRATRAQARACASARSTRIFSRTSVISGAHSAIPTRACGGAR